MYTFVLIVSYILMGLIVTFFTSLALGDNDSIGNALVGVLWPLAFLFAVVIAVLVALRLLFIVTSDWGEGLRHKLKSRREGAQGENE